MKSNIFGTIYPSEVAIIIDDVLFAGPMMYDGMNILKENNIKTEIVAVVLVRSLGYLDFFAQYAEKWNENVDLIYLKKYLDTDFENIIKK